MDTEVLLKRVVEIREQNRKRKLDIDARDKLMKELRMLEAESLLPIH